MWILTISSVAAASRMDGTLAIWLKAASRTNFPAAATIKHDPATGKPLSRQESGGLARSAGQKAAACLD
jgi:hypothetical protein